MAGGRRLSHSQAHSPAVVNVMSLKTSVGVGENVRLMVGC